MSDSSQPPLLIRDGAQRIKIYNEGLCVYLFDAANRDALLAANGWEMANLGLEDPPSKDPRLEPFGRSGMLVTYELQQDDPISVDVIVGQPPTAKELKLVKGLKWKKPQTARLVLPSGVLWIDTPNSCRINPEEEPQEAGGEVRVPPGEYVLTLHRVDWDESDDKISDNYRGPQEIITLTRASETKLPRGASWALPWPVVKTDLSWVGNYTVADGVFNGMVNFWDYWEFFWLNLDRAAFEQMGLGAGSLLEMTIGKPPRRFVIAYLGDKIDFGIVQLGAYKMLCGHDAMTLPLANESEVAYALFKKRKPDAPQEPDLLMCMRVKASEAVDKKFHEKWKKMTLKVLPQRLQPVHNDLLGQWAREDGAVRGKVLLRTSRYLSVNFDSDALGSIGATSGDTLTLKVGDQTRAIRLFADGKAWMAAQNELTGVAGARKEAWEKLHMAYMRADPGEGEDAARAQMRKFLLGDLPLAAYLDQHWLEKDRQILLIQPSAADRLSSKLTFAIDLETPLGSEIVLSKK